MYGGLEYYLASKPPSSWKRTLAQLYTKGYEFTAFTAGSVAASGILLGTVYYVAIFSWAYLRAVAK